MSLLLLLFASKAPRFWLTDSSLFSLFTPSFLKRLRRSYVQRRGKENELSGVTKMWKYAYFLWKLRTGVNGRENKGKSWTFHLFIFAYKFSSFLEWFRAFSTIQNHTSCWLNCWCCCWSFFCSSFPSSIEIFQIVEILVFRIFIFEIFYWFLFADLF